MLEFKWDTYGYFLHYMGAGMHLFYIISLTIYIYNTYLTGTFGLSEDNISKFLLVVCIIYPFAYDSIQLYKQKWDYFKDPWNYTDLAFHWSGITNLFFQFTTSAANL